MRCPFCTSVTSFVKQTTRPIDEGMAEGDVKRRLRKCRSCSKNFSTFEIHESKFREIVTTNKLERQPLLVEEKIKKSRTRLGNWTRRKRLSKDDK